MRNKIVLENIYLFGLCENAWLQMATHNVILKNGDIATKLVVPATYLRQQNWVPS